jgi:hypothetical protein
MCEYMVFLKCVQFPEVLYSISGEANGRHAYITRVLHLSKGRRALWRRVSLLLNMQKKESLYIILHGNAPCGSMRRARWHAYMKCMCTNGHTAAQRQKHRVEHKLFEIFEAHRLPWV